MGVHTLYPLPGVMYYLAVITDLESGHSRNSPQLFHLKAMGLWALILPL